MVERGIGYVVCRRDHDGPEEPCHQATFVETSLRRLRVCFTGVFVIALSRQPHIRKSASARRPR